jgi:hypothetical protein
MISVSCFPLINAISLEKESIVINKNKDLDESNINEIYINSAKTPIKTSYTTSDVSAFPNEETPLTLFAFEEYTKDWDADRGAWRYRFRYDWYQAKRMEPWGDGTGFDEWPYVVLEVDLSITESNIVPNSANDFAHGGWNVHEQGSISYPYPELAANICNLIISTFPYVGLAFSTGLSLAQSYKDAPEQPEYTWMGLQVKEGSGFFQFDCYVYPEQKMETWIRIDVWGSSVDRMYQSYYMLWHHTRTAPSEPEPDISVSPTSYDFGEVAIGNYEDKSFKIKNAGSSTADVTARLMSGSGVDFSIESGGGRFDIAANGEHTVTVRFSPSAKRDNYACLEIIGNNCNDIDVDIYGTGYKKSKSAVFLRETITKYLSKVCEDIPSKL